MRFVTLIAFCALLSDCAEAPPVTADMPTESCLSAPAAIEPRPGAKPSEHLALVERMACAYGQREATARSTCLIDVDIPTYFPGLSRGDTYGLKESTAKALVESEMYGGRLTSGITGWMYDHMVDPHDVKMCLSEINGSSAALSELEDYTRGLRRFGY